MPGWFVFALGFSLPLFFWLCHLQGWPFWWCGVLLLPLAWPRRGGNISAFSLLPRPFQYLPGCLVALLGLAAIFWRNSLSLQFYPVLVNLMFLLLFAFSLTQKQSLIERLARRFEPDLPESGVRYTRAVTKAWCLFFLGNGAISLWSIHAGEEIWALYNGLIAYLLMGLMFAGEWLIRQRVRRRAQQAAQSTQSAHPPHTTTSVLREPPHA
ncbi:MAG: hypothetical protein LBC37_06140 [Zoogloeaceae bacterium]|jgi:uncharacterized membrane protein|nr:hypothetical protein [Zoogloeaceae bacterium]